MVLSISNLSVQYGSNQVISELDLNVQSGEIIALFGPSGCGKTTVLKAIAGLLEQVSGQIELDGTLVLDRNVNVPTEQRQVGMIFQDYALFPHLTVQQNIEFGLTDLSKVERQTRVTELLDMMKLTDHADKYPHQLSGGQQQRVAIMRALARRPHILLFDEAFSNIDPQLRFELIDEIRHILKQQGTAALFVTHNQDEAFAFCDKIAVVQAGHIAQIDTPAMLFSRPTNRFIAEFLGPGIWIHGKVVNDSSLHTDFGEVSYIGDASLVERHGDIVDIYLRPHQLTLIANDQGSAVVCSERFIGECYQSTVQWQQQTIKVRHSKSLIGRRVDVHLCHPIQHVFPPLK